MSRAIPHYVRVIDAPGQPAHVYPFETKTEAVKWARAVAGSGFVSSVVKLYKGQAEAHSVNDEPVRVWL